MPSSMTRAGVDSFLSTKRSRRNFDSAVQILYFFLTIIGFSFIDTQTENKQDDREC